MTLTTPVARYTQDEKTVIFNLLEKYEEIIDIKYRKSSRCKTMEVRDCWKTIHDSYNNDPRITTKRNMKQLQKFWLNARLRNRFPSNRHQSTSDTHRSDSKKAVLKTEAQQSLSTTPEKQVSYEVQIIQETITPDDVHARHMKNTTGNLKHEPHDTSLETASNDNLSINDLLQFKNSNVETRILEISQMPCTDNHEEPAVASVANVRTIQRNDETTDDMEQSNISYYYEDALNSGDESLHGRSVGNKSERMGTNPMLTADSGDNENLNRIHSNKHFTEYLRTLRMKEAEFRLKEQQMKYERERIEAQKSREELHHMREVHKMQLEEMRIKLKQLEESGGAKNK